MPELHTEEHLDPTAEISLETVKSRAIKGVAALSGRYVILFGITLLAQGLLGAFLSLEEWGVFAVVSAVVNFLVYFSDIGLAASLIQKKDKITRTDLATTFTTQQILVFTLLLALIILSPFIRNHYGLSKEGVYLLYALGASFLMSSLKTIPSVLLERELKFEKLAASQILETLAYNGVLIYFASTGAGVMSFTWGVLARGIVGLVSLYYFKPWKPTFGISRDSLSHLLKFGIPYQINSLIAVFKDDGMVIILGGILGLQSMGILLWAQKWAQMPLRLLLDQVTKVTFPAFSRMQDEKDQLERSVTKSLFFLTLLIFPATVGLVLIAPIIIQIIPRYEKWEPALIPLALVSVNTLMAAVSTQLTNLLNSIGKIKTTFKLMVMWAGLTWLLVPSLAKTYGVNGAALAYALVGLSSVVAIYIVKRQVNFSLWNAAGKTGLATFGMAIPLFLLRPLLPVNLSSVVILTGIGGLFYSLSIFALTGRSFFEDVEKIYKGFSGKQ